MTDDSTPDIAIGVRAAYDAVARTYDAELADELDHKPLDRALLAGFLDVAGPGVVADVGCGPGHVTRYLAGLGADVMGVDLSPAMVSVAHERGPELPFLAGSMLQLPIADAAWAGAVALYSIIHFTDAERAVAFRELARAIRPDGALLVSFHVESPEFAMGQVNHLTEWFGRRVEFDGYFLDPAGVIGDLEAVGFSVIADLRREPLPGAEYPSRRCYLIARRNHC